jgi:DNA/RNA endonuclease YhcR with UshA esterase domain
MSHCPSCGRHAGPYEACPYCGARLTGRTPIRIVKIAAILLTTVGLVALWFAATRAEVPRIQIGQAGATMNMAYVRIQGQCTREPSYDPESDYLSFWLADQTGEIRVSAYRAETREIIERGLVPGLGDQVEVAGTLRVREDFFALTINVPDQLTVTRAEPVEMDIGAIEPDDMYLRVRVRGQVYSVFEPYEGLTLVTVRDQTGEIPIAVSEDLQALSGATPRLSSGQSVEVVAAVSVYGDTPQLVPARMADITVLDRGLGIAIEKSIGELTVDDEGQLAIVQGTVVDVNSFSSGTKCEVDDGTGTIVVLLWQDVLASLPDAAALGVGAEIKVQGEVSEYEGELEIIPEWPEDVEVLAAAPAPVVTQVGALTEADVGRQVVLRGTLGEPDVFSAGVKFALDDGSGTIVLLLWQDVYDEIPDAGRLTAGAQVEITGQIGEYEGELQIVPESSGVTLVD